MYKLIIVDDEVTEIRFVRYVVNTFKLPLCISGEAENGEEAVNLVRTHGADFVIMDIHMPVMDGLAAAEIIKKESPLTKIYLLTAYESFAYAQQAIKVDVDDYLLKPIKPEVLAETLKKGITEVLRQRLANREINKMKRKVEVAKPLLKRQLMLELVTGDPINRHTTASMKNVLGLAHIEPAGVVVATADDKGGKFLTGDWLRETLVKEIEQHDDFGLCDLLPSGVIVLMVKAWDLKTQQALKHTIESWERKAQIQLYAGFAPIKDQGDIPAAFELANKISRTALFWRKPGIFFAAHLGSIQDWLANVRGIQKTVFNLLLERKLGEAQKVLRRAFGDLPSRFIPPEQIMTAANQIVNALLFDLAEQVQGKEASVIAERYLERAGAVTSYAELEASLFELLEDIYRWFDAPKESLTEQSIYWAASYIRQHYQENITLEQMAGKLFLSPSYFSRQFKQHIGEGFAMFLTRVRMEHAHNLLASGKLSVAQVAKQVGYSDPSYFSTVYKKRFGVSPQQVMAVRRTQKIELTRMRNFKTKK